MNTRTLPDGGLSKKIISQKDFFEKSSQNRRQKWLECYKNYNAHLDKASNPYLANLFIPKTHEAVESLSAYFAGSNQTITARPEDGKDVQRARIGEKLLEYQWRKVLQGRRKVVRWIKQDILFGNGLMKVGWDYDKNSPWMTIVNLTDVYFDYFTSSIQDSPIIHKIIKFKDDVEADDKYDRKDVAKALIEGEKDTEEEKSNDGVDFGAYDESGSVTPMADNPNPKVTLFEYWSNDGELITLGRTSNGYEILRRNNSPFKDEDNNYYKPFVKIRCKDSILANRAYDIGAIEPTIKIQKAFNDAVNEFFDNVTLVNNKQWIKKRGASINPNDLIRKPGGIITVDDINTDLKSEEVSDVKASIIEMINFLDNEFQQASMVVNLMKGVPGADTATEAVMGQQNVFNLFDSVNQNIQEGMSELGQMLMGLNIKHLGKVSSLQILDSEEKLAFAEIDRKTIKGRYEIRVVADRKANQNQAIRQKQLLDFLGVVGSDPNVMGMYPHLPQKIYKKWLEEAGFADADWFFDEDEKQEENIPVSETEEAKKAPTGPAATAKLMTGRTEESMPSKIVEGANKPPTL
ncbi:MAG: portal protein [Candidatus Heimdallarchaeota archaeon]